MPKGKGTYGSKVGRPPKKMEQGGKVQKLEYGGKVGNTCKGGGAALRGTKFVGVR